MSKRLKEKHSLATRWFHWVHFPLLALMIGSGMLIYWANDVYRVGVGRFTLVKLFPTWFYDFFHVAQRLAEGMAWHFFVMWLFALNGIAYVAYTLWSGAWRELVPTRASFKEALLVTLYDLRLSKFHPPPRKFNGAQQIAYTAIIVMGGLSLLTGLAIYKPVQLHWLAYLLGGYEAARFEHFWLTMGYLVFFVIHIAQVIRAGWNNFRSMVVGVEVVDDE